MNIKRFLKKILGILDPNITINVEEISGEEVRIYSVSKDEDIIIKITGDIKDIQSNIKIQVNGNILGSVASSNAINCGNIVGNVTAVSVNCGNIKGTVISHKNANFDNLYGDLIDIKK